MQPMTKHSRSPLGAETTSESSKTKPQWPKLEPVAVCMDAESSFSGLH